MGGRARVRAGVVWVCLALGAGGIVVLWGSSTGTPAAPTGLVMETAPAARAAADANTATMPVGDGPGTEPRHDRRAVVDVASPVHGGQPHAAVTRQQIDAWIQDLRDDDVRWNAATALEKLIEAGDVAVPALERALWSDDVQQQFYAARALHALNAPISDRYLTVLVDAASKEHYSDTKHAYAALLCGGPRAIPFVRPLLDAGDYATRFRAAHVLARLGDSLHAESISHQMVRHLGHNRVPDDAVFAANALYHIGAPAVPILQSARGYLDDQGRALVDLILLDLRDPPRTKQDFMRREVMQRQHQISRTYADPVVQLDLRYTDIPRAKPPR